MNFKLGFVSLILAVAAPLAAFAQPVAGKIGTVTLSLVHTRYSMTESTSEKPTLVKQTATYKNIVSKYGNKEFIADLIQSGFLSGSPSDWSLKYIQIDNDEEFEGLFAVSKTGTIFYLNSELFDRDFISGYGVSGTYVESTTYKNSQPQLYTETLSVTETSKVELFLRPEEYTGLVLTCFRTAGYAYKYVHNVATDTPVSDTYTVPEQNFTSVVGHNHFGENDGLISGSINVSALKDGDVGAYLAAVSVP